MHISKALPLASALLLSATPLVAADDFDSEDIPRACTAICDPIRKLVNACNVDDDRVGGDRNEDLLERQCICENDSFDVANIAGQCQSCIEDNWQDGCGDRDDDDNDDDGDDDDDDNDDDDDDNDEREDCDDGREDIGDLMRACGFSSVSYDAAATESVQSISVSAVRATDTAQLTTTVNPEETGIFGTGDNSNSNNNNGDSGNQNNDDDGDDGNAAAQGSLPGMAMYVAGAVVAGAFMLH